MSKELNVKSSTIEKGMELAKEFVGKLIGPAVEEVGLLIADKIKFYRYKNQIKILLKAKKLVESNNMKTKEIPLKILVPLLDNASLEEDDEMQDKWANMIANLADSEKNMQSHIFPLLLSQISNKEFKALKILMSDELNLMKLKMEHLDNLKLLAKNLNLDFNLVNNEKHFTGDILVGFKKIKRMVDWGNFMFLENYECNNLVRLGLIQEVYQNTELLKEPQDHLRMLSYWSFGRIIPKGYRITSLGNNFLEVTGEMPVFNHEVSIS